MSRRKILIVGVGFEFLDRMLMNPAFQLQGKRTRHRRTFWTNARLQNLTLHCFETLNAYGVSPGRNTLARSGRSILLIS